MAKVRRRAVVLLAAIAPGVATEMLAALATETARTWVSLATLAFILVDVIHELVVFAKIRAKINELERRIAACESRQKTD